MNVRQETEDDITAIHEVEVAAFGQADEANLVDALRRNGKLVISLVAEQQGKIAGHIGFSEMETEPRLDNCHILGLAPVAVIPSRQKKGIGSALITRGLTIAQDRGYTHVVLLGEPLYYSRFGFLPARAFGITNEYTESDEFMIRALGVTGMPTGVLMKYQPEFAGS
jgi:putative acetyltransferase